MVRLDIGTNYNIGPIPKREYGAIVDFHIDNHPTIRFNDVDIMMGDNGKTTYLTMNNQTRYLDRLIDNMKMSKTLKFEIYYNGNVVRDTIDMNLFMKNYLKAECFSGMNDTGEIDARY